ncbi:MULTISPECIES: dipeptide ABC transporter ATP-binding protein [Microbacterium]|uniref:dipeptide ABC transporter ATP-binding protein n=1 Tax=Microbacterium TaxID=33882 RepID=UPI0006FD68CA|nr:MULTISPECIES: ABC transporter ATP-binding protein [unclassified Microbacterium]MBN9199151.1 ABC transporter ATP-binding protein [Microbacterium ginsengisoli]MCK9917411.1 ABC transporter ATP-binding protein [Microbacteriaceae bacterium K1510]KQR99258.1 ABC transporter ATP-binding protein [Microbacterium sp. Leaf347]KQS02566.1 ABC transporter ATP-binding protein [Microbacterium sp. Leaf351]OJU74935.1 MAG: ABC transporter ATP-binding protein [Microbacterium sp. 71-23]
MTAALLQVDGLRVEYTTRRGPVVAVRDVSFTLARGETLAIVGESGSGKSTTVHALLRLLSRGGRVTAGRVLLDGTDLLAADDRALRAVRGRAVGLVPQDPVVSLNPVVRVGTQIAEVLRIHGLADRDEARRQAIVALGRAGIADPELRAAQYPHELSGGLRQRVLIALAIVAGPALILADEPTSALDVTVQRQILDHLDTLKREAGTSLVLVTHDLGVAADRADRILVMTDGEIVESGTPDEVLGDPRHPYTKRLIAAAPSLDAVWSDAAAPAAPPTTAAAPGAPLVVARGLVKEFPRPRAQGGGRFRAVDGVDVVIAAGETLALVGESGSGKTTTARLVLRLDEPTAGTIAYGDADVTRLGSAALRGIRRRVQLVQQNPYAALNPRLTVAQNIADPLAAFRIGDRASRRRRAVELVDRVALPASALDRKPAELSGGQRQRVAIARALAVHPELVVLDEPVSALDVSIQDQILTLLADLQSDLGLAYLFISHDLAVVRRIAHRVAVMRGGRVVESGTAADVLGDPRHEYTRALINAIPGRVRTSH